MPVERHARRDPATEIADFPARDLSFIEHKDAKKKTAFLFRVLSSYLICEACLDVGNWITEEHQNEDGSYNIKKSVEVRAVRNIPLNVRMQGLEIVARCDYLRTQPRGLFIEEYAFRFYLVSGDGRCAYLSDFNSDNTEMHNNLQRLYNFIGAYE
jgi:hypothetical protein